MKIKRARAIDIFAGIPLCFLFSVLLRLSRVFFRPGEKTSHKILFLGLTEIGAGIMAYPAIEKLRAVWKDADVYLWVFKDNADFFEATGWFAPGHVIAMRSDSFFHLMIDTVKNLRKIHKAGISTIIDLEASTRFSSLLCCLTGASTRAGFYLKTPKPPYRGDLYTHRVPYDPSRHISENFWSLTHALFRDGRDHFPAEKDALLSLPEIKTSPEEDERMRCKLRDLGGDAILRRRLVLVHMGLNDRLPMRRWPPEYYWRLIDRFLENPDLGIVLVGTGPTRAFFKSETRPRVLQLVGQTNTRELFSLLNMASALVSHDSGIVHIAALTPIPVVALFGPETPDVFGPLNDRAVTIYKKTVCSPCLLVNNYKQTSCEDNQCMRNIGVDEVYQTVMRALP